MHSSNRNRGQFRAEPFRYLLNPESIHRSCGNLDSTSEVSDILRDSSRQANECRISRTLTSSSVLMVYSNFRAFEEVFTLPHIQSRQDTLHLPALECAPCHVVLQFGALPWCPRYQGEQMIFLDLVAYLLHNGNPWYPSSLDCKDNVNKMIMCQYRHSSVLFVILTFVWQWQVFVTGAPSSQFKGMEMMGDNMSHCHYSS